MSLHESQGDLRARSDLSLWDVAGALVMIVQEDSRITPNLDSQNISREDFVVFSISRPLLRISLDVTREIDVQRKSKCPHNVLRQI